MIDSGKMYGGEIRADYRKNEKFEPMSKDKNIKPFGYGRYVKSFGKYDEITHVTVEGFFFDCGEFGKLLLWLISNSQTSSFWRKYLTNGNLIWQNI